MLRSLFLERLGDWLFTIALTVVVYRQTESLAVVALLLLAQVLARLVVLLVDGWAAGWDGKRILQIVGLARLALVVSLLFAAVPGHLWWSAVSVAALGALGSAADSSVRPCRSVARRSRCMPERLQQAR